MFKKLGLATCVLVCSFFSVMASAGVMVDIIDQNEYVGFWGSHSYTHDLTDQGFVFGSATSATLEVQISDDGGRRDGWEVMAVVVEDIDFDTGGVTFGDFAADLEVNALFSLNADGMLDVTIASLWGDFYVGDSTLTANVPEPAALFLFALGLIGLGATRRRAK